MYLRWHSQGPFLVVLGASAWTKQNESENESVGGLESVTGAAGRWRQKVEILL